MFLVVDLSPLFSDLLKHRAVPTCDWKLVLVKVLIILILYANANGYAMNPCLFTKSLSFGFLA